MNLRVNFQIGTVIYHWKRGSSWVVPSKSNLGPSIFIRCRIQSLKFQGNVDSAGVTLASAVNARLSLSQDAKCVLGSGFWMRRWCIRCNLANLFHLCPTILAEISPETWPTSSLSAAFLSRELGVTFENAFPNLAPRAANSVDMRGVWY